MSKLRDRVLLDRYAERDPSGEPRIGTQVMVSIPVRGQADKVIREVGVVTKISPHPEGNARCLYHIKVKENQRPEKDWDELVDLERNRFEILLETTYFQICDRLVKGIGTVDGNGEFLEQLRQLLYEEAFVPAGRIWAGIGKPHLSLTLFNCYVKQIPGDSRKAISQHFTNIFEIFSRGGGCGWNLSVLRPKGAPVRKSSGRSSGVCSWATHFAAITGTVQQGGCFALDTRMATDVGLIPAEELAQRVERGEQIFVPTHLGVRPVTAVFRNGSKPMVRVTTERGYSVKVSVDHEMGVLHKGRLATVPISDLAVGDEVLINLTRGSDRKHETRNTQQVKLRHRPHSNLVTTANEHREPKQFPRHLNAEVAYLLGYMIGNGHNLVDKTATGERKGISLSVPTARPEIVQRLLSLVNATFATYANVRKGGGACVNVEVPARTLTAWLTDNACMKPKSADIRVPEIIFRSGTLVRGAFVSGYFDADGGDRGTKGGCGIDSVSKAMLEDLQILLADEGILARMGAQDRSEQGWQTLYHLSVTGPIFRLRMSRFMWCSLKDKRATAQLNDGTTYPIEVFIVRKPKAKYYAGAVATPGPRVSYSAMKRVAARLAVDGNRSAVHDIKQLLNTVPDRITSLEHLPKEKVVDFEVADVHMLTGDAFYTKNSRRGASLQCLDIWHPDALEFMAYKNQWLSLHCHCGHDFAEFACPRCGKMNRKELNQVWENSNVSLCLTAEFMTAVEQGLNWNFVFPDTSDVEYDQLWDGNLTEWRRLGKKVDVYKTVKAREVWDTIIKHAHATGDPGLLFMDRANEMSNSWYYAPLISTNPCVAGSTRLHSHHGMVPIKELTETKVPLNVTVDQRAIDPDKWGTVIRKAVPAFMTHKRSKVYKVTTKAGYEIEVSAWHDFYTKRGKIKLKDLKIGDELLVQSGKGQFGPQGDYQLGRLIGLITGDGHFSSSKDGPRATVGLWNKDRVFAREVADHINTLTTEESNYTKRNYSVNPVAVPSCNKIQICSVILARVLARYNFTAETKLRVPEVVWRGTEDCIRGYLQGLFQTDGTVAVSGKNKSNTCSARLSSSDPDLLKDVQILLANFGIFCAVYKRRKAGKRLMPDGQGGHKLYKCRTDYELIIDGESRDIFMQMIGFLGKDKNTKFRRWARDKMLRKRQPFRSKIVSIAYTGTQPVYDTTQPDHNTVIFNGLVTGQCAEEPLPSNGICNLSHLNLGKFMLPNTGSFPAEEVVDVNEAWIKIDLAKLTRAIKVGVRFLDTTIELNTYHDDDIEAMARGERRLGLGVLGYGELLCRLGLRYGSRTALEFTDRLFQVIKEDAYSASIELAREKGPFPFYKQEQFLQGKFVATLSEQNKNGIALYGIRNVTLLTAAPSGSVGTMVGTSTGVEPYIYRKFQARSRIGTTEESINIYEELSGKFGADYKKWPKYVVTSNEIPVRGHIETVGVIQRHIDSSVSKTVNMPNSSSLADVEEAYLLAYRQGCKGVTIYRDGSKEEQVFYNRDEPEVKPGKVRVELISEDNGHGVSATTSAGLLPPIKGGYLWGESNESPLSSVHPMLRHHPQTGDPYDFFLEAGKGDVHADAQAMARLISVILRWPNNATIQQSDRLQIVVKQLFGIHGSGQTGFGPDAIYSQPDAIAKFLIRYLAAKHPMPGLPMGTDRVPDFIATIRSCRSEEEAINFVLTGSISPAAEEEEEDHPHPDAEGGHFDLCPRCNGATLVRFPGHCTYCINQQCGHSEC